MSAGDCELATQPRCGRARRTVFVILLSLAWPGLGHLAMGRPRRGVVFAAVLLPLVPLAARLLTTSPATLLALAIRPSVLTLVGGVNGLVALYRLAVLLDAWRTAVPSPERAGARARWGRRTVLAVVLVVLVAPHALTGYATYRWYSFLRATFPVTASSERAQSRAVPEGSTPTLSVPSPEPAVPSLPPVVPAPFSTPVPLSQTPATPTPTAEPSAAAIATPEVLPTPTPTPVTDPLAPALADGRLVVLLIGTDAGPGRWSARADSIIVVVYDARSQRAAVVGVPRNVTRIPVPPELDARYPGGAWPDLANALYTYGVRNPELFPGAVDPGAAALAGSLERLLDFPIDYTVSVDMGGFVRVIDAIGGVTIDVPRPVATWLSPPLPGEGWRYYEIPAGRQHLDGHAALAYVRSRTGTSDYDRMQRQRCLLAALYRQTDLPALLFRLPGIVDAVRDAVRTDIPLDALPELVQLAASLQPEQVSALGLTPPEYVAGWAPGGYPIPDTERARRDIGALLEGNAPARAERFALPDACDWRP